jgi:glycosyltransferase involved in cell wall biosynthesis
MRYEVIMSAYNDVEVLELTLSGYLNQVDRDFYICIADDGSGVEVKQLVEKFRQRGLRIRHIWHEDLGFRRTVILNKAVATSSAERVIFTDSDCIPNPLFVADHKAVARPKSMVTGPRVYLGADITAALKSGEASISELNNTALLFWLSIRKQLSKIEQALRYPAFLLPLLRKVKSVWPYGANFAVDRQDLLLVNGFDEDFLGWGGEDIDLYHRLSLVGVKPVSELGRAVIYHLDHPIREADDGDEELTQLKQQKHNTSTAYCANGMNKWLD